ncbi:MAG: rhodanese-like domain-containing protein [Chloroflexi bacterium]|nr:rhodanese-like domain-containing protein [Chloroflexota bacterium]
MRAPYLQGGPELSTLADAKGFKNIGVEEFDKLRADKKNVVLDVRTPKEYAAGHIAGALNIDWNAPDFSQKIAGLGKDKVYLIHCAVGGRSAKACDKMAPLNFQNLYNLEGGFKAWEKAGKPVVK